MTEVSPLSSPTAMLPPLTHDQMANRARRFGALLHARNVLMTLRAWWVSLFAIGTIEPLLLVLALGVGMGVAVDAASPGELGVPFLQFVAPALLLTVAVQAAQTENTFPVIGGFKWHQTYQAANSTGITGPQLATGHWLGATVRYIITFLTMALVLLAFGAITAIGALQLLPIVVLTAWSFGNPMMAWSTYIIDDKGQISLANRLVVMPLTLFSGTYFPLEVLPSWMHPIGWVSPLWHGVNLARIVTLEQEAPWWLPVVHVVYLAALTLIGLLIAQRRFQHRLLGTYPKPAAKSAKPRPKQRKNSAQERPPVSLADGQTLARIPRKSALFSGYPWPVISRGLKANWGSNAALMFSGIAEPVLYLLAMGLGLGTLIGSVGDEISYAAYIAPGLLASSAMMGAVIDTTWNVFFKLKFSKLFEAQLATSLGPMDVALGEIAVALVRGGIYAGSFIVVMTVLGLVNSWWIVLAVPACLLIAFGFAALGLAATSFCRTFQQIDWVVLALTPMFMFSGTFYPVEIYPEPIATVVKCLPLWHAIELLRELNAGQLTWASVGHVAYFVVLAVFGTWIASLRLKALFLR